LVGLALVDISGFDSSIWSYCERLRASTIPFLVIVPKQNFAIQREILAHGAQGVLVKPLVVKELMGLIANFLRDK
jgi:DNA-binding response OmpR family regulator